jgi:hypothetical protein
MEDTSKPSLMLVASDGKSVDAKGKRSGKASSGLTVKQEAFAQALAAGNSNADSYRLSYECGGMKENSIHTESSKLANHPAIAARVRAILDAKAQRNSIYQDRQREKYSDRVWRNLWAMIDAPDTPPAVKANLLSLGAKAAGMLTDSVKIENISADSKSIESELIERLQQLSKTA